MRSSFSVSLVLLLGVLTSGGLARAETQDTPPARADKAPAPLPEPRWKGLPGWLGFATVKPGEKHQQYWTPEHPDARAVLFSDLWNSVPKGTKVTLLSTAGVREGTYLGTSDVHYGCEENTATLAGFGATEPLPEGPVWVLPGSAEGATSLPVKEVPASALGVSLPKGKTAASKEVRAFEAGGLGFLLTKTGKLRGQLTVYLKGKRVAAKALAKGDMAGSEKAPLNLYDEKEVDVPRPLAAYRLGQTGPVVVVLGFRSYEGHHFMLAVRRGDKAELIQDDNESLYFCAF
ncbi:hypothetical protein JQX13_11345 [Archangium violaceum]|uniref:hypothetical protein n=1 Tax=Archangium violaceum TaxID=83451 RepID=UPI00193BDA27|nr:hypothetical protein [Archangium violaceum]QRK10621.1 hypothetical protein JQX13_11345 [Archangium violaceum]